MLSVTSSRLAFRRSLRCFTLGVAVLAALPMLAGAGSDRPDTNSKPAITIRATQATYEVSVGLDGEIYPVFANYASLRNARQRSWGTVAVRVTNSTSEPLRNRIAVQFPGWSDQEIQIAELGAGESKTYLFAPTFLRRLYLNREIAAATASVTVTDPSGAVSYQQTLPVRMRSVDDLYWGNDFQYAPFIASWVTPHDGTVERLLGRAKEFMPGRRLPGYESSNAAAQTRSTYRQARAIYRALQEKGVSYVKSSMTFGGHEEASERVRMPAESLDRASANCIDGAVMYASLFENLGMEPVIALVPGHAYVGVKLTPNSDKYLYVETSLTGRSSFEAAVASARRSMAKVRPNQVIRIDIRQARLSGIYPMPSDEPDTQDPVLDATRRTPVSGN
ncbi:MAG TPA: hypothetical protein VF135_08865 [Terriglobales bacterium]